MRGRGWPGHLGADRVNAIVATPSTYFPLALTLPNSAIKPALPRIDSPIKAVILANVAVLVFTMMDGVIKDVSHVFQRVSSCSSATSSPFR